MFWQPMQIWCICKHFPQNTLARHVPKRHIQTITSPNVYFDRTQLTGCNSGEKAPKNSWNMIFLWIMLFHSPILILKRTWFDYLEEKCYNIHKARSSTQAIGTSEVRPALDGVRGHTESVRTCLEPAQASIIGEDLRIDCRKAWPQKAAAADVRQWAGVLSSGPFL